MGFGGDIMQIDIHGAGQHQRITTISAVRANIERGMQDVDCKKVAIPSRFVRSETMRVPTVTVGSYLAEGTYNLGSAKYILAVRLA